MTNQGWRVVKCMNIGCIWNFTTSCCQVQRLWDVWMHFFTQEPGLPRSRNDLWCVVERSWAPLSFRIMLPMDMSAFGEAISCVRRWLMKTTYLLCLGRPNIQQHKPWFLFLYSSGQEGLHSNGGFFASVSNTFWLIFWLGFGRCSWNAAFAKEFEVHSVAEQG